MKVILVVLSTFNPNMPMVVSQGPLHPTLYRFNVMEDCLAAKEAMSRAREFLGGACIELTGSDPKGAQRF